MDCQENILRVHALTWISLARVIKCHRWSINFILSEYLSYNRQVQLAIYGTKILLAGFIYILNKYISNISNLYNSNVNLSLASQKNMTTCFQIQSQTIYIHIFQLRSGFIFWLLLYVVIIHLLQRDEGVGIYCKLIPN